MTEEDSGGGRGRTAAKKEKIENKEGNETEIICN